MANRFGWPDKTYQTFVLRKRIILWVASIITIIVALYSMGIGSIHLSFLELIKTIVGKGTTQSEAILFGIRLPRVVAGLLVGATLSITGTVMQCVLRNPLASSSTLGVSQGAAFGAAIGIVMFSGGVVNSPSAASAITIYNPYIVTVCAFLGGSISTVFVIIISQCKKEIGPSGLILAGVALSSLFSGGSTLLQYFADETKIGAIVFWTFGNLGGVSWKELIFLGVILLSAMVYFIMNRWNYNVMEGGTDSARSLGVNTRAVMLASMAVCSFAAAVSVSFVGIISFVGLIAPHIMRRFVGNDYRFLIPCSAVAGALLLVLADTFGRWVLAPVILPIGAITSFLGAPMFLFLLFREVKSNGTD